MNQTNIDVTGNNISINLVETSTIEKWKKRLSKGYQRLKLWRNRASQRYQLQTLDDHTLKDIGITRIDALREASKPFWRR